MFGTKGFPPFSDTVRLIDYDSLPMSLGKLGGFDDGEESVKASIDEIMT
jgi:hypothetical protein